MVTIRHAQATDLPDIYRIFYINETAATNDPPPPPAPGSFSTDVQQIYQTGKIYVAEKHGHLIGYTAAITRGNVTYLTDLFIDPQQQSAHLGTDLLQKVLPANDGKIHCTVSSTDFRAQSLYIRSGMQPQWPNYCLISYRPLSEQALSNDIETSEGEKNDPAFVSWDTQVSGRPCAVEHSYWIQEQHAIPLWFRHHGETIGYGYVRLGAGTFWSPTSCWIGPIGVKKSADATSCVLAAVRWASKHKQNLRIDVPGPHPALAALLNVGFTIVYQETFVSSANTPFFEANCYVSSGSSLF